jgi:hypothetical protein
MKLKAPEGVGDPCVAGVAIASCDGFYEVETEVAALLIECFGFVEIGIGEATEAALSSDPASQATPMVRRGRRLPKDTD